jgi:hypothetical protein
MEYNSQRAKLPVPEYGRNLQKMVEFIKTFENREKRTQLAYQIVDIMAEMHTLSKETADFRHKLWDHLHIMSNFNLDVDSPFPVPDTEILYKKPNRLDYPKKDIKFHHYGKNIELIINYAKDYEEGPEKDLLVKTIANHLKKSYLTWNRDSVNDELITDHLAELSDNKLELAEDEQLNKTNEILARNAKHKTSKPAPNNRPGQSYSRPNPNFQRNPHQQNKPRRK